MNEFKEQFSELLLRYGSLETNVNNNTSEMSTKLTNQQIVETIQEVMRVTLKINLQNMEDASLKTPANEIVITTPNAPDVLRVDYNQNSTQQSSDEMTEVSDNKSSITELDTIKHKKTRELALQNKSKQGLNTTYVRGVAMLNKLKQDMPRVGSATTITMYMVEEAYKNAVKVSKKLEDLKELLTSEAKPSQRLSAVMRLPVANQQQHHHHQQQTASSIQRAKAHRRYVQETSSDTPVTPTTSRPSLVPSRPPKKNLPRPADKRTIDQYNRTLAESSKFVTTRSPQKSQSRSVKYAHVQSTIPKLTSSLVKRKAQ